MNKPSKQKDRSVSAGRQAATTAQPSTTTGPPQPASSPAALDRSELSARADVAPPRVGRPAATPRLRNLDGDQLTADIAASLSAHAARVPNLLTPKLHPRELGSMVSSALGWAREGQPARGESDFVELARALFGRAVDCHDTGLLSCARCKGALVEHDTRLGTFILAGEARHRLSARRNVTVPQLAALANFDRTRIFQLIADRDLYRPRSNEVSAESAIRMLVQIGVPGFKPWRL